MKGRKNENRKNNGGRKEGLLRRKQAVIKRKGK